MGAYQDAESKSVRWLCGHIRVDFEAAQKAKGIKRFVAADMEWLRFVVNNRKGNSNSDTLDMHIGPVADDNVYQPIRFFETGIYDAEEMVKRLKTEVL